MVDGPLLGRGIASSTEQKAWAASAAACLLSLAARAAVSCRALRQTARQLKDRLEVRRQ
jgi:hypothetical protein